MTTELMNPTLLKRSVDDRMSIIDRIRVQLQSYNKQEVYFNLGDFSASVGIERFPAYQALHRLEKNHEIELIKESIGDSKRERICGARLLKMTPAQDILDHIAKVPDRGRLVTREINRVTNGAGEKIPALKEYMKKKTLLDKIKDDLSSAGFDPNTVLVLPLENQMAEEGLYLYGKWVSTQETVVELQQQIAILNEQLEIARGEKRIPETANA